MPRSKVVVHRGANGVIIRRGQQWAVLISPAEALAVADALVDAVEREES